MTHFLSITGHSPLGSLDLGGTWSMSTAGSSPQTESLSTQTWETLLVKIRLKNTMSTLALCLQGWVGPVFHLKNAVLENLTISWIHLLFRAASHGTPSTVSQIRRSLLACIPGSTFCCSPFSLPSGFQTLFYGHCIQGCHWLPRYHNHFLLVNSRIQLCITPAWPI